MNKEPKYRIAVIDDEVDLGAICVEILQIHGFDAVHYCEPDAFLKERFFPIDLLITDINLGVKSGYEIASEYQNILKNKQIAAVPTLFISGAGEHQQGYGNLDPGSVFFLEKPFNLDKLLSTVYSIFNVNNGEKTKAA